MLACLVRLRAANIDIEKTDVSASTIHYTFDFDGEYKTRLEFSKLTSAKVADLMMLEVAGRGGGKGGERSERRGSGYGFCMSGGGWTGAPS